MRKTIRKDLRLKLETTTLRVLSTVDLREVGGAVPNTSYNRAICKSNLATVTCVPDAE